MKLPTAIDEWTSLPQPWVLHTSGRFSLIAFNRTGIVRYRVLYLERRWQLYTLAMLPLKPGHAEVFPGPGSLFFVWKKETCNRRKTVDQSKTPAHMFPDSSCFSKRWPHISFRSNQKSHNSKDLDFYLFVRCMEDRSDQSSASQWEHPRRQVYEVHIVNGA